MALPDTATVEVLQRQACVLFDGVDENHKSAYDVGLELLGTSNAVHLDLPNFIKDPISGTQIEVLNQKRFVKDILRSWRATLSTASDPVFVLIPMAERRRSLTGRKEKMPLTATSTPRESRRVGSKHHCTAAADVKSPYPEIRIPKELPQRAFVSPNKISELISAAAITPLATTQKGNNAIQTLQNICAQEDPSHVSILFTNALVNDNTIAEDVNSSLHFVQRFEQKSRGVTASSSESFPNVNNNNSFFENHYSMAASAKRAANTSQRTLKHLIQTEVLHYKALFNENKASSNKDSPPSTKPLTSLDKIRAASATLPLYIATAYFTSNSNGETPQLEAPTINDLLGDTGGIRTPTQKKLIALGYRRREIRRLRAVQESRTRNVKSEGARRHWAIVRKLFWEKVATRKPDFMEDEEVWDKSTSMPKAGAPIKLGAPPDAPLPIPLSIRQQNALLQQECVYFRDRWSVVAVDRPDGNNRVETHSGESRCAVCDGSASTHTFVLEPLPLYRGRVVKGFTATAGDQTGVRKEFVLASETVLSHNDSASFDNAASPISVASPKSTNSDQQWRHVTSAESRKEAEAVSDLLRRLKHHDEFSLKKAPPPTASVVKEKGTPTTSKQAQIPQACHQRSPGRDGPRKSRHLSQECRFGVSARTPPDEAALWPTVHHASNLTRKGGALPFAPISHHHRACKAFLPKWGQNEICEHCYCHYEEHTYLQEQRRAAQDKSLANKVSIAKSKRILKKLYSAEMPWGHVLAYLTLDDLLACVKVNSFLRVVCFPLLIATLQKVLTYQPTAWRAAVAGQSAEIAKGLVNPLFHLIHHHKPSLQDNFNVIETAKVVNQQLASSLQDLLSTGALLVSHRLPTFQVSGEASHSLSQRIATLAKELRSEDLENEEVLAMLKRIKLAMGRWRQQAAKETLTKIQPERASIPSPSDRAPTTNTFNLTNEEHPAEATRATAIDSVRRKMEILRQTRLQKLRMQTEPDATDDKKEVTTDGSVAATEKECSALINPSLLLFYEFLCVLAKEVRLKRFAQYFLRSIEDHQWVR